MIRPVSNNNYTSAYRDNSGKNRGDSKDAPAFLLGDEDGVIYEPSKKDKPASVKDVKTDARSTSSKEHLSTVTISSANKSQRQEASKKQSDGIFSQIKKVFNKIFRFIWYGDEQASTIEDVKAPEPFYEANEQMQEAPRPAHNTTVLTRYDRYGHIVNMSGGDTARILQKDTTYTV